MIWQPQQEQALFPSLLVIDVLRVGPVEVKSDRLRMPYTLIQGDVQDTNDLIYKYTEDVFDPDDPHAHNLAGMIGVQLALNYGLFCRRIIFDGLFDAADRRLILDMLHHSAREILVHKLYKPNPFLVPEFGELPIVKAKIYTQAEVQFVNSALPGTRLEWSYWASDRGKHCVLSSGGKDSLLSYGLLKEAGLETHAIFGNESGRHWYTALNGFRYLRDADPNTSRVWLNSDRLFAWMLRHLSFIRADFARLRADDYPIRLWTVAVFAFGVLPLMRKRGIGRLVIGDEYDSSQRGHFQDILHYQGLYDQSHWFDAALSRYYLKKGWSISQFSLLRPLSELLIMKTLVERYPQLQAQQVSCHAAHERDGRIYPCGQCEKCRRIVGMLTALEGDPINCGYTSEQVDNSLQALRKQGVKQLGPDASQLYYLLDQKGAVPSKAKEHTEVMHLRFDRERSPLTAIPLDLRAKLFPLLLQHASGALMRRKHAWEPVDPLTDPGFQQPYPFERVAPRLPIENDQASAFKWANMSWQAIEERLKKVDIALLPVGAIEQHGPHLPVDIDAFDAEFLANQVARTCSEPQPFVLPLVPYGVSYHHDDFAGTISLRNETMAGLIYDIGMSLARQGIRKLIMINGHGDNAPTLNYAAQMINRDSGIFVAVDTGETSDADLEALFETFNDVHAGEIETSTTMAARPAVVDLTKAEDQSLLFASRYLNFSSKNGIPWYVHTQQLSPDGTMGNPLLADAEKGRRAWEIMIAHLVALVEEVRSVPLEDLLKSRK